MAVEMIHPQPHHVLALAALLATLSTLAFAQSAIPHPAGSSSNAISEMVAHDEGLAALDSRLAAALEAAAETAGGDRRADLEAEQQAWLAARDACVYSADPRACVESAYRVRLAELAIETGQVIGRGPFVFDCGDTGSQSLEVTYYDTEPPTAQVLWNAHARILAQAPAASGAKYQGHGLTFWEHQGEASLTIGVDGLEVRCTLRKRP